MALKRVRTPHYIAGFGEGRVNANDNKNSNIRRKSSNAAAAGGGQQGQSVRRRRPGSVGVGAGRLSGAKDPKTDERLAAQEHPALAVNNPAAWRLRFADDLVNSSGDGDGNNDNRLYGSGGGARIGGRDGIHRPNPDQGGGPWQLSALALLFSVVLLSALFLHVISDAQKTTSQGYQQHRHRNPHRRPKTPRKKKTDEWSDDNDEIDHSEDLLLSERVVA